MTLEITHVAKEPCNCLDVPIHYHETWYVILSVNAVSCSVNTSVHAVTVCNSDQRCMCAFITLTVTGILINIWCCTWCIQGFGGETWGRKPLGWLRSRWEDNIKINLYEMGWGCGFDSSGSAFDSEFSVAVKCGNLLAFREGLCSMGLVIEWWCAPLPSLILGWPQTQFLRCWTPMQIWDPTVHRRSEPPRHLVDRQL